MSRGTTRIARPLAVWLAVSAATALAARSVRPAWSDATVAVGADRATGLLVAACATALAVALTWLWVITTVAVRDVLRGSAPEARGAARRLVLLACGVAVAAGTAVPAHAGGGDGPELLAGLPLPERAVAPADDRSRERSSAARPAAVRAEHPSEHYVVRPGDSLWSIAVAHPGSGGTDARWRAIWAANRTAVGDDPDLIHPGQALRLPPVEQDGAR